MSHAARLTRRMFILLRRSFSVLRKTTQAKILPTKIVAPTALYKTKNNVSVEELQAWTSIVCLFVCLAEMKSSIPGDSKEMGLESQIFSLASFQL